MVMLNSVDLCIIHRLKLRGFIGIGRSLYLGSASVETPFWVLSVQPSTRPVTNAWRHLTSSTNFGAACGTDNITNRPFSFITPFIEDGNSLPSRSGKLILFPDHAINKVTWVYYLAFYCKSILIWAFTPYNAWVWIVNNKLFIILIVLTPF